MHRSEPKATRGVRVPPREIHRLPVGGHLDLAALVAALGLVPGVDPFVLLDGEGWDLRVLAFEPEHTLTIRDASPFEKLRGVLSLQEPSKAPPSVGGWASTLRLRLL